MKMKVLDLHIGWSDYNLEIKGKDFEKDIPDQVSIKGLQNGGVKGFIGGMCPVKVTNHGIKIPRDSYGELKKHLEFYKKVSSENDYISLAHVANGMENTSKVKVILGVEGCYFIKSEQDLSFIRKLKDLGVRVIGPVWNISNFLASSCNDNHDCGLTNLGKRFVEVCNDLGMIIDGAHSSKKSLDDILELSKKPVIVSHTASNYVCSHPRNLTDIQIRKIAESGGLVGISFVGEFIGGRSLHNLVEHVRHILDIGGKNVLCLGSDFDGMGDSDVIDGLENVGDYSNLANTLIDSGVSQDEIDGIFWDNASRFLRNSLS
jgi:membrane dipeptidase